MTIYVDALTDYGFMDWRRGKWAHMWGDDANCKELHEMAEKIGMKREWFQDRRGFPHYDLRPSMHERALENGARLHDLGVWINKTEHSKMPDGDLE